MSCVAGAEEALAAINDILVLLKICLSSCTLPSKFCDQTPQVPNDGLTTVRYDLLPIKLLVAVFPSLIVFGLTASRYNHNGVLPFLSRAVESAPCSQKYCTTSSWPPSAASCSGVHTSCYCSSQLHTHTDTGPHGDEPCPILLSISAPLLLGSHFA